MNNPEIEAVFDGQQLLDVMEECMRAAYRAGRQHEAEWLAIWNDGEQFVGVSRTPLKKYLAKLDDYQATDDDLARCKIDMRKLPRSLLNAMMEAVASRMRREN